MGQAPPSACVDAAIRGEFPIFQTTTYLNSCSQGPLSHATPSRAGSRAKNGAEWDFWVERNEAFRAATAGLLRADPDDVAVTTSVSQGVSGLVSALDLGYNVDEDVDSLLDALARHPCAARLRPS